MTGNRHRAREFVLKALYALEQSDSEDSADIFQTLTENSGLDKKTLEFGRTLFRFTSENIERIDAYIQSLASNWDLNRMAVVDKNILRLAIAEVEFMPDVPIKVAINEAIELAKKYSTLESASFVNGILDTVLHKVEESKEQG
jgi:N utilization substance protein B